MTKEPAGIEFVNDRLRALLCEIKGAKEFYVPLQNEKAFDNHLRALAKLGLIRWCPYPEEFYIVTPRGAEVLNTP